MDQRVWLTHTAEAGGREEPCAKKVGALASVWMRSTGSRPMVSTNNGLQRGGDEPHQHNEIHSPRVELRPRQRCAQEVKPSLHRPFIGQHQDRHSWGYHVSFTDNPWEW